MVYYMIMRGFKYHKNLCPDIWDSSNNVDPLVAQAAQMAAWDFVHYLQFLGVPLAKTDIVDIILHGSTTNYYWDNKSDVDIAIIADLSRVADWNRNGNLAAMIKAFAQNWKRTRPMKIGNRHIDIALMDKHQEYAKDYWKVGSIYSLLHGGWIHKPIRLSVSELRAIKRVAYKKYRVMMRQCKRILRQNMSAEFIDAYLVNLRRMRMTMFDENYVQPVVSYAMAFKMLRNTGIIRKMRDKSKKMQSKTYCIK